LQVVAETAVPVLEPIELMRQLGLSFCGDFEGGKLCRMLQIEQSCFWLATRRDPTPSASLQGNVDAEIVIVGGGFTGMWTAFFLKQLNPQADVVLVEQGVAGYGGSGRNAGIVGSCIDHSHALAIVHFGREEAAKLAQIGLKNFDELAEYAADCDFERSGQLQIALTEKHMQDCRANLDVVNELGLSGYRLLSAEETQKEVHSPLYLGAAFIPSNGIVNPIKLVDKIKNDSKKAGVRFFERTKVTAIKGSIVKTEHGTISARQVILATDAYTHLLFPQMLWRYIPLYDYIIVSEPLTTAQHQDIGWRNRQGCVDGRTFFNYYRLTADNRILWGTSEAQYYAPNRVDLGCDHSQSHYSELRDSFKRHFPRLADLVFPYEWGGPIASTTRLTPFFGTLESGKVIYALGYTGHGIGSTRVAGKILAHMALKHESELLELDMVKKKPFPYPPEPLRSLSVKMVTGSLRRVDRGENPNILLRFLDTLGIGFSS
jgi:glycine/D-amino acid oxidase-like deaminating enzyme